MEHISRLPVELSLPRFDKGLSVRTSVPLDVSEVRLSVPLLRERLTFRLVLPRPEDRMVKVRAHGCTCARHLLDPGLL